MEKERTPAVAGALILDGDCRCEMKTLYQKITKSDFWNNSVWSKLIADGIRSIIVGVVTLTGIGLWMSGVTIETIWMFIGYYWHWLLHGICIIAII